MKKIIMMMLAVLAINILVAQERRIELITKNHVAQKLIFWNGNEVIKEINVRKIRHQGVSPNKRFAFITTQYNQSKKKFQLPNTKWVTWPTYRIMIYNAKGEEVANYLSFEGLNYAINDEGILFSRISSPYHQPKDWDKSGNICSVPFGSVTAHNLSGEEIFTYNLGLSDWAYEAKFLERGHIYIDILVSQAGKTNFKRILMITPQLTKYAVIDIKSSKEEKLVPRIIKETQSEITVELNSKYGIRKYIKSVEWQSNDLIGDEK